MVVWFVDFPVGYLLRDFFFCFAIWSFGYLLDWVVGILVVWLFGSVLVVWPFCLLGCFFFLIRTYLLGCLVSDFFLGYLFRSFSFFASGIWSFGCLVRDSVIWSFVYVLRDW